MSPSIGFAARCTTGRSAWTCSAPFSYRYETGCNEFALLPDSLKLRSPRRQSPDQTGRCDKRHIVLPNPAISQLRIVHELSFGPRFDGRPA